MSEVNKKNFYQDETVINHIITRKLQGASFKSISKELNISDIHISNIYKRELANVQMNEEFLQNAKARIIKGLREIQQFALSEFDRSRADLTKTTRRKIGDKTSETKETRQQVGDARLLQVASDAYYKEAEILGIKAQDYSTQLTISIPEHLKQFVQKKPEKAENAVILSEDDENDE